MSQIGIYYSPESMDKSTYEGINKALEAAGADSPKGRLYHFCFGEGDKLMVFDVFESRADFDAFGEKLMPVMNQLGFDAGQPSIMPIVNAIVGK